jgi:hypothetical protein
MSLQQNLKMTGCFTSNGDVELATDLTTLRELIERLNDKALPQSFKLYIPATAPAPYDDYLEGLAFRAGDGLLNMEVIGKVLFISGSEENIQALSDDIGWLIEEIESNANLEKHLHLEHYPDHPYLSPSPVSLVIRGITS